MTLIPVVLSLNFLYLFQREKHCFELLKILTKKFLKFLSFSIFIYQPNIFAHLFFILDCSSFYPHPGKSYATQFLYEECFTHRHFVWIFALVLPALLFYAAIHPILNFIHLFKNQNTKTLNQSFRKSVFYW